MSTSTLKTRTVVLLLGATLACGVRPAQTQYSPAAHQTLVAMLNGAPPYEQRLIMNAGYGGDIRTMQANGFQQTQTFLGQQAEGWSGTLGATTQFRGNSGWRGEGYTPSVGMQMYRCGAYNVLLPNNGLPYVGCEQVYTR